MCLERKLGPINPFRESRSPAERGNNFLMHFLIYFLSAHYLFYLWFFRHMLLIPLCFFYTTLYSKPKASFYAIFANYYEIEPRFSHQPDSFAKILISNSFCIVLLDMNPLSLMSHSVSKKLR